MKWQAYHHKLTTELCSRVFWRDVAAEFVGTFLLMSVQAALPTSWGVGYGGPVQVGLGMGFTVTALAWTLGDFSGGHFNPAVTIAMAAKMSVTFLRALVYIIAQCAGALLGAAFIYGVTPSSERGSLSATRLGPGVATWQGVLTEAWITAILMVTILGSTNQRRKGNLYMATIPIGMAVTLCIMSAFVHTGASMNPARSLGPAVVMGIWDNHWVYWVGPILGSLLALLIYALLDSVDRPPKGNFDGLPLTECVRNGNLNTIKLQDMV